MACGHGRQSFLTPYGSVTPFAKIVFQFENICVKMIGTISV